MRILIIHNKYRSILKGGEDIVFEREKELLENNLGADNIFIYTTTNDKINKWSLFFTVWFNRNHYKGVKEVIIKNKIDLVHIHNFFPLLSPSVIKAANDCGVKVIQTLHNFRWWCANGTFYRSGKGICEDCVSTKWYSGIKYRCYKKSLLQSLVFSLAFKFYLWRGYLNLIDAFFVLSGFQKSKLIEIGIDPTKMFVKPNLFSRIQTNSGTKKGFVYVGRLDESKGILNLIRAWQDLPSEFQLKIIGNGDYEEQIRSMQSENIKYLGAMSNENTINEIAGSKYLLQMSLMYETFGLTILEAFSLGTPVIAFDIGSRSDLVRNGYNGFLCNNKNLVDTIKNAHILDNYDELSNNAILSSNEYSADRIFKLQFELYQQVIGNTEKDNKI